jgi:hypothetical protein
MYDQRCRVSNLRQDLHDVAEAFEPGQSLAVEGEQQEVRRDGKQSHDLSRQGGSQKPARNIFEIYLKYI